MDDEKKKMLIDAAQSVLWSDPSIRKTLQSHGINIIPSNFYSNVPSIEEIEQSYEYLEASPPYLSESIFNAEFLRDQLVSLFEYSEEFNPPNEGNEETCENGYFWKNSQFSYSDAMSYYAFVRKLKPRRIVEIGSGFSTLVAASAIKANGFGSIACIEPYPRPFLPNVEHVTLHQIRAQDIDAEQINSMLDDGDILFIDSTHTVKTGSDCLHIYLRLLPQIKKNILIHIHDIFLPFGMPQKWVIDHQIYWTEQYLLLAWLQDNPKTTVIYGSVYHQHFNRPLLEKLMNGKYPSGGASFWLEYRGKQSC